MVRRPAAVPDDAADDAGLARARRITIGILILVAVGSLAISARTNHTISSGERWFLLAGSLLFAVVVYVFGLMPSAPAIRPAPWAAITVVTGLAVALFVVGGMDLLGSYVAIAAHAGYGATFAAIVIGPMTAFFGYSAGRRADMVSVLRRTRADLARAAVAEERLRIARDVHDL